MRLLEQWRFLRLLELLGKFTVVVGMASYLLGAGDRAKQKHYQAWQVLSLASGKEADFGRSDALRDLAADGVPIVGLDLSGAQLHRLNLNVCKDLFFWQRCDPAYLGSVNLQRTVLAFADFETAWLVDVDFTRFNLGGAKFRNARFGKVKFTRANLGAAHFEGVDLNAAVDLEASQLDGACLSSSTKLPPYLSHYPVSRSNAWYCAPGSNIRGWGWGS